MSHLCPLCGKEKNKETLFCDDCTKKLRTEYEVDLPQQAMPQSAPAADKPAGAGAKTRRKTGRRLLRMAVTLLLLMGAFFLYNELIRKGPLERNGWDAAIKENSVEGYLTYIENHPKGAHFADAQAALMKLKEEEASRWEAMKHTDRVTELRDFLLQYPESHYAPLVKRRLDSLTWMGALHTNTSAAYSDYMVMAESGDFNGDYLAEAELRYGMLFQSYPVDVPTLDSIRMVLNGFCSALSAFDHAGLEQWLAPRLQRFFKRGAVLREQIVGELPVAGGQTQDAAVTFIPDLEGVQYEKTMEESYRVNVPVLKSRNGEGIREQLPGYILHLGLNPYFQITSVYETTPYPGAP